MRWLVLFVILIVGVARADVGRVSVRLHDVIAAADTAPAALVGRHEISAAEATLDAPSITEPVSPGTRCSQSGLKK